MIDQVPELVQKPECRAAADPRDTQVDRVLLAKAVGAGLTDRRGCANGYRLEIGAQAVKL
jgi:hypothetical protein